uniref:Kinesin motor domain-containing protein n=1 Tax=Setaria italica TaxID=4555 RepID=K3Y4F8_SETIT
MDKRVYVRPTLDTSYICRILYIMATNILRSGSGKTYTMRPLPLKASQDILRLMHHAYGNQGFQLFVSFFEIYGGKLFDLRNDRR